MLNIVVVSPMPRARATIASTAIPGCFRIIRRARRTSDMPDSEGALVTWGVDSRV